MNKSVFLSFDIEVVVSKRSKNLDAMMTVVLGALEIARLLDERQLKATFFISLSAKDPAVDRKDYLSKVQLLIKSLQGFDNIDIQPHLHAFDLPVSFACPSDDFADYNQSQQIEMLLWAKEFLNSCGVNPSGFRPGGYKAGENYYQALKQAGYHYSSTMDKSAMPNIDLITKQADKGSVYHQMEGINEFNVTSVKVKSVKPGVTDIINLSPDFFTINSVKPYFNQLDALNINFHSFSMFSNRLARENHQSQLSLNLRYILIEKPLRKLNHIFGLNTYSKDTVFSKELIKWLDELSKDDYKTLFYSEYMN